jgi:hypothetical protein
MLEGYARIAAHNRITTLMPLHPSRISIEKPFAGLLSTAFSWKQVPPKAPINQAEKDARRPENPSTNGRMGPANRMANSARATSKNSPKKITGLFLVVLDWVGITTLTSGRKALLPA